jgi:putative flippase GtrA
VPEETVIDRPFPARPSIARRLWDGVVKYMLKFGVVGLIGMVIDVGVFNLLRLGALGHGHFVQGPVGASVVSVSLAVLFNWVGNRYWTFRQNRRRNALLELLEYGAVSVAGLLVSLACLWVSHYALGYDSLLADNISKNVVGLVLGTILRFALFRYWVWGHHRSGKVHEPDLSEATSSLFAPDAPRPARGR